ncbi:type II toxin-antitoxin system RelE/ParE family toxin [Neptunicella sp.]|uniref:type II toxin-antitoxin system RelE/ParE family toxin n=1 Tax=Neptunicella sp. TaxID=2125986 RepID=UPI003F6938C8
MSFNIRFSQPASADLIQIYDYYLVQVSSSFADTFINKLQMAVNSLADNPERGSFPKELLSTQASSYRQLVVQPFRIIYQIKDKIIYIHAVLDQRRNVRAILQRRLLNQ